jgi:hypothetical protein
MYLIWSIEHEAWWKPNKCGYTFDRDEAGRYPFDEAKKIVGTANQYRGDKAPNEAMVPVYYRCEICQDTGKYEVEEERPDQSPLIYENVCVCQLNEN